MAVGQLGDPDPAPVCAIKVEGETKLVLTNPSDLGEIFSNSPAIWWNSLAGSFIF